jgi:predicted polyphosphate/ATP-dependent NAD kinase
MTINIVVQGGIGTLKTVEEAIKQAVPVLILAVIKTNFSVNIKKNK